MSDSLVLGFDFGTESVRAPLVREWALQAPADRLEATEKPIGGMLAGVDRAQAAPSRLDFTFCPVLPIASDGTPVCLAPRRSARGRTRSRPDPTISKETR